MDADWIEERAYKTKQAWRQFVIGIPLKDDPRWDESMGMRHTWEWLERIASQVRRGEEIRKQFESLREEYMDGKIVPSHPNTRKGYCELCGYPIPKGQGMKYTDGSLFCVLHDPQYEHCPRCGDPMIGACNRCE